MSQKKQYVMFDLGGTLLYRSADWREIRADQAQELSQYLLDEKIIADPQSFSALFSDMMIAYFKERDRTLIEIPTSDLLRQALSRVGVKQISEEKISSALKVMYSASQAYWFEEEDALLTLEILRKQGYRMGLVSNANDGEDVRTLLRRTGIEKYMDVVIISAEIRLRKPHLRMFQDALSFWQAEPAQAVMVGDLLSADVMGAQRMGIGTVWITRRADKKENMPFQSVVYPDKVICCLAELPDVLKNW